MTTLFITHDLSTAYYLGGEMMVMSRGHLVEHGPADDVMHPPRPPLHPAPAGLVALARPRPAVDGALTLTEQTAEQRDLGRERCLFAERCPHVFERCWNEVPDAYPVGPAQWARCFLYDREPPDDEATVPQPLPASAVPPPPGVVVPS